MNKNYRREEIEVEEDAENPAIGMIGEIEREYKRVVWMSSVKKGRAYWKGYLEALEFAIGVINRKEEA